MCSGESHHQHHPGRRGRHPLSDFGFVRNRHSGPFGGPFGGPDGPFGPGRGPRGRGRRRRGDVRLALLMLLAEEPRNGYGLMQTLEERSDGRWRPSPGSVYPALSQLEDEGFVRAVPAESGRTYELTDAGRSYLEQRGETRAPWEAQDEAESSIGDFRRVIASTAKAAAQVVHDGDERQIARAVALLDETRRALYRLLAEEPEESA